MVLTSFSYTSKPYISSEEEEDGEKGERRRERDRGGREEGKKG